MSTLRLAVASVAILFAGCRQSRVGPGGMVAPRRPPQQVGAVPATTAAKPTGSLSRRIVYAKEEPATLYTRDGASCKVTPSRFKDTAVGDEVWCNWENSRAP